jgi:poly(hydroxyalkanoate) granule-associated protein
MVNPQKFGVSMASSPPKKPAKGTSNPSEPPHIAASKDIWLAGLGAMAQAQAQARAQGSKTFEALVAEGLAFQRKSQAAAQEKITEAAAHFNQMTQGLSAGLVQPMAVKVDRLEHLFEDRVARALKSLGLPTAAEVADLQERVAALEAALSQKARTPSSKVAAKKRPTAPTNKATKS